MSIYLLGGQIFGVCGQEVRENRRNRNPLRHNRRLRHGQVQHCNPSKQGRLVPDPRQRGPAAGHRGQAGRRQGGLEAG